MRKRKNNGIVIELCGIPLKKERKALNIKNPAMDQA
jgi:hypothetical protein